MDAYVKPGERKTGQKRPRIVHLPPGATRQQTASERRAEKEEVAAVKRAIKKSARRHLRQQLEIELSAEE